MKHFLSLLIATGFLLSASSLNAQQQDKSKRPSPPATVTQKINSGATITIDYSQPSIKGRTVGKDVEPMKGQVWRMGANEATVFQTDKDVTINGQKLPAGKYSLFGLWGDDNSYTVIFNTAYNIWGTQHDENKAKDVLKVPAKMTTANTSTEKLVYTIDKSGLVTLKWGPEVISFNVK